MIVAKVDSAKKQGLCHGSIYFVYKLYIGQRFCKIYLLPNTRKVTKTRILAKYKESKEFFTSGLLTSSYNLTLLEFFKLRLIVNNRFTIVFCFIVY